MVEILIVDDDPGMGAVLSRKLGILGYDSQVTTTLNGGLEKAAQTPFDLVLLDVQMPDGNGLEFLPKFKEAPSSPEVIIITGQGDPDGAEKAILSGAWVYIEKPILKDINLHLARAHSLVSKAVACSREGGEYSDEYLALALGGAKANAHG